MSSWRAADAIAMLIAVAARMREARDELCALDGEIGDGDHGVAMDKGFAAVAENLAGLDPETADLAEVFKRAAQSFLNAVGASSGPLYATAFLRAAQWAGPRREVPLAEVPQLFVQLRDGVAQRGKAAPGDKTMLDVWHPAAAAGDGAEASLDDRLAAIVRAARDGAEATVAMRAGLGRAARLGERSVGHMDPGAASAAMIVEIMTAEIRRAAGSS